MPTVKYRTTASRNTQQSYDQLWGLLMHLAPFASELKAVSAIGQPEMGYTIELTEPIPANQLPHLEIEFLG